MSLTTISVTSCSVDCTYLFIKSPPFRLPPASCSLSRFSDLRTLCRYQAPVAALVNEDVCVTAVNAERDFSETTFYLRATRDDGCPIVEAYIRLQRFNRCEAQLARLQYLQ